jgi:hypothetical protein
VRSTAAGDCRACSRREYRTARRRAKEVAPKLKESAQNRLSGYNPYEGHLGDVASYASFGVDCRRLFSATFGYGLGGVVQTEAHDRGLPALVANLRFLRSRWLKRTALLAALICAVGGEQALAQNTQGQQPQRLFGDARDCPPGHRIEFVLPATTIYVDPHWLGSMTIGDLKDRGGPACPTGPVNRTSIELGYGILRALDLHRGIGAGLMRFNVGGYPDDPQTLTPGRSESDAEPRRSAPWIEDDTVLKGVPDIRGYRLYYPTAKGVPNRPVRISCGGDTMHRLCAKRAIAGRDTPFDGVHYGYQLSQSDVPVPVVSSEYSTDPTSEPGALLEFDSRFRAWFLTLMQKP